MALQSHPNIYFFQNFFSFIYNLYLLSCFYVNGSEAGRKAFGNEKTFSSRNKAYCMHLNEIQRAWSNMVLEVSISFLFIPILVTFDIWRNKSLQSFFLFSLLRAYYNGQRRFIPSIVITVSNLSSLCSLWVQ